MVKEVTGGRERSNKFESVGVCVEKRGDYGMGNNDGQGG